MGMQLGVLNLGQPTINAVFNNNSTVISSIMSSAVAFGAVFGCLASSFILTLISPRGVLILADFLAIGSIGLSQIINIPTFICYRLLAGFVSGLNSSLIPRFVKEYSTT